MKPKNIVIVYHAEIESRCGFGVFSDGKGKHLQDIIGLQSVILCDSMARVHDN